MDNSIKAVVLRINCSGVSTAASQEITAMMHSPKKPVVVSMRDTATSGAYCISVYADRIVPTTGSAKGSIGPIAASRRPLACLLSLPGWRSQRSSSMHHLPRGRSN